MGISQAFLGEIDHEAATTRRVLERVPIDKMAWKPHEKSMTMGQLATHIPQMAGFVPLIMTTHEFDIAAPEGSHPPPEFKTSQELLDYHDASMKAMREALVSASDEALGEMWTLKAGDKVIFSLPRTGVMRAMIMNHIIHHRGQLSVYLRLNNIPVPSIYGPSADEEA